MRILVVEDEAKTADYLKRGLEESGYRVEVARNGVDGKHLIEEEPFDLDALDDEEVEQLLELRRKALRSA